MAAAITVTATRPDDSYNPVTVSGTGFTASTPYIVAVTRPSGNVAQHEVASDGAGAFTVTFTSGGRGLYSVAVRPRAEYFGTTTAAATGSITLSGT